MEHWRQGKLRKAFAITSTLCALTLVNPAYAEDLKITNESAPAFVLSGITMVPFRKGLYTAQVTVRQKDFATPSPMPYFTFDVTKVKNKDEAMSRLHDSILQLADELKIAAGHVVDEQH